MTLLQYVVGALVDPAVVDDVAVDPEAHAVVADDAELVVVRARNLDLARPLGREVVAADVGRRRAAVPVEVDRRVDLARGRAGEVLVAVVRAREAVGRRGRDRRRGSGRPSE